MPKPTYAAGLSGWVTDRLYEAGAEDVMTGMADSSMSVGETGKWTALAVLLGIQLGAAARGILSSPRIQVEGLDQTGRQYASDRHPDKKKQKDMAGLIRKVTKV